MGRKKISEELSFDDVYGSEDYELFEATNPGIEELIDELDEEESDDFDAEMEDIPAGISSPEGDNDKIKKKKKKDKGKESSKRSSKKRMSHIRNDPVEAIEAHELFQQSSTDDIVDDMEDNDDLDELIRKKSPGWMPSFQVAGLGGGAMSSVVLLLLLAPAVVVNLLPGVSYARFGQFLFVPAFVYIYLSFPVFLGWVFAMSLRYLGPLNGYPFRVGALSITPWIKDWKLYVRLLVQDAAFGNPPGFPFEDFVSAKRVDIEGCFSFKHLGNLLLFRKEKVPLKKVPDFERYIKFDFNHVEVDDAMCNFQMFDGKFNINEFTRILANGEVSAVLKREPFPNQLCVRIIRAKHLQPHRLKKTCDPYVVVRCRRQERKTHTQNHTVNPMWNEELVFHVDDASVVIEIAVYDRDAVEGHQASLIGHWAMTTKYLGTNPSFCWHYNKEFKEYSKNNRGPGASTGFEGWIPLATKKWKKMGMCGQLQVELLWKHVPEAQLQNRYEPSRRYTALEQLTQQSNEDQLRFGDWARFRDWLNHEPFCYDIRRFTVRGTRFFLQDLFRGHKGGAETLVKGSGGIDSVDCVKLPILEMRKQFRPKNGDEGITSYDVFVGFFIGLLSSAARSGRLGGAIAQILSGGMFNFGYKFKSLLVGQLDKALRPPIRPNQIKGVASMAKSGFAVMHQNITQRSRNKAQFKIAVEADDTDFLNAKVERYGHLDRCAVKIKGGEISNAAMAQISKRKGNFKTKYFELKGDTLFYRKHKVVPKGVTYNLTYKISLDTVYSAVYVKDQNELLLNVQEECHVVRLRDGSAPACGEEEGTRENENDQVRKWIECIKEHDIPFEEFKTAP